jgi:chitinase
MASIISELASLVTPFIFKEAGAIAKKELPVLEKKVEGLFARIKRAIGAIFHRSNSTLSNKKTSEKSSLNEKNIKPIKLANPLPKGPYLESYWESWNMANASDFSSQLPTMPVGESKINIATISFGNYQFGTDSSGQMTIGFVNDQVQANGSVYTPAALKADIQKIHAQGGLVKLSLGGATFGMSSVVKDEASAQLLGQQIAQVCAQEGLDGVDFDIEDGSTPANLQVIVYKTCRELLGPEALISYTIPASAENFDPYNTVIKQAGQYFSAINVMCYDYYWSGYQPTQDFTALNNLGISNDKIVWGIMPGQADDPQEYVTASQAAAIAQQAQQLGLAGLMMWDANRDTNHRTGCVPNQSSVYQTGQPDGTYINAISNALHPSLLRKIVSCVKNVFVKIGEALGLISPKVSQIDANDNCKHNAFVDKQYVRKGTSSSISPKVSQIDVNDNCKYDPLVDKVYVRKGTSSSTGTGASCYIDDGYMENVINQDMIWYPGEYIDQTKLDLFLNALITRLQLDGINKLEHSFAQLQDINSLLNGTPSASGCDTIAQIIGPSTNYPVGSTGKNFLKYFNEKVSAAGIQVDLSFGGAVATAADMKIQGDPATQAQNLAQFMENYGFNSVDFDIESPTIMTVNNPADVVTFFSTLHGILTTQGKQSILTIEGSLQDGPGGVLAPLFKNFDQNFDGLNLMLYSNSQYYLDANNPTWGIEQWMQYIPDPSQIHIGFFDQIPYNSPSASGSGVPYDIPPGLTYGQAAAAIYLQLLQQCGGYTPNQFGEPFFWTQDPTQLAGNPFPLDFHNYLENNK